GILRPGDIVLSITGKTYDTLEDVISGKGNGSLLDFGVKFCAVPLKNGGFDFDVIREKIAELKPKTVYMQRSRGYEWRKALTVSEIESAVGLLRGIGFDGCIMLDNCYGEFVEKREPTEVGVDLVAGSLIKNPGGGIAPTGGYVCGNKRYVDLVQNRLTAPSIGGEVGSYPFGDQYFYQGLFLAPHTVLQSMKGAMLFSYVLGDKGYKVSPNRKEIPRDIITMTEFNDRDKLISFIQNIQENSPVDSNVRLLPWDMPGYEDQVIMAAGCFVQGSSIELSADAPIKPPYIAYLHGGLTYEHCKIALKNLNI
ncbi:MAG: methionine gamma-lyase family protein, partial [Clostridia bacterium]|nr:methionine gamma-lyase family protein [Clostridia bacterium]